MDDHRKTSARRQLVTTPPIFVDRETAAEALGIGLSTFMREVRAGRIPPARSITPGRVGWLWTELQDFAARTPVADNLPPPNAGKGSRATLTGPDASRPEQEGHGHRAVLHQQRPGQMSKSAKK